MLETIKVKLTSVCPMLMHNCQLADPTNKFTKELKKVSGKRKKTDEDHETMSEIEFMGGLYTDGKNYLIPSDNIEGTLIESARKEKMGKIARAAIFCEEDFILSKFDGPKPSDKRFADPACIDKRMVKVQSNRILRTRPKFTNWESTGTITFDSSQIDRDDIERFIKRAGYQCGLGDYRPKYGRFEAKIIKE